MGTSFTKAQGDVLQDLYKRERLQPGWGEDEGMVFVEGPRAMDYGVPGRMTMCLPCYRVVEIGLARRIGYVRIGADGRVFMPREYREALEPAGR